MGIAPASTGINFAQRNLSNAGGRGPARTEQPKANYWLNVGYYAGEGEERRFVSLPVGIPVDTQEALRVSGQNQDFNNFNGARNELLDALKAAAGELPPGGETLVNLQIQLRRVNDEVVVAKGAENAYSIAAIGGEGFSLTVQPEA